MNYNELDSFLEENLFSCARGNGWIKCPGFRSFYLRAGPMYLSSPGCVPRLRPTIDLANISALHPGHGAFTRLLKHLEAKWPTTPIHVESVVSDRFAMGLRRRGFLPTGVFCCFFLDRPSRTQEAHATSRPT